MKSSNRPDPVGSVRGRALRRPRVAALVAAAGALGYTASKVHLAIEGRLGLPGFPAPEGLGGAPEDIRWAQFGNAAIGLAAAGLALILLVPIRPRPARWSVYVVSWAALVLVGAGFVGFTGRVFGLVAGRDVDQPAATITLLLAAGWPIAWATALVLAARSRPRAVELIGPD